MAGGTTAYTALGVAETATGEEIKRAWLNKRRHFGSMRAGLRGANLAPADERRERQANQAYEKLGKPSAQNGFPPKRQAYDAELKAARDRIAREAADRQSAAAKAAAEAKAEADRQAKAASEAKSAADAAAAARPQPQPTWPPAPPSRAPQQPSQTHYTIRIPRVSQSRRMQAGVATMLLGAVVLAGQFQQSPAPLVVSPVAAEPTPKLKKPVRVAKRTTHRSGGRKKHTHDADRRAVADANRQQLRQLKHGDASHEGATSTANDASSGLIEPRSIGLDASNPQRADDNAGARKRPARPNVRNHDVYQPLVINLDGK